MQHQPAKPFVPADTDPAPRPGALARAARAVATRFGWGLAEAAPEPFRDSDFESDSGFLGRPLGDH
ncbi:MAG: hypothetical protein ACXWC6_04025 [Ramlibacter sp.]